MKTCSFLPLSLINFTKQASAHRTKKQYQAKNNMVRGGQKIQTIKHIMVSVTEGMIIGVRQSVCELSVLKYVWVFA